jgi:hypothetical protein
MKNFTILLIMGFLFLGTAKAQSGRPTVPQGSGFRIMKFFPNPASTYIHFEFQKDFDKTYILQIYNFLGKKVADLNQVTPRNQIDVSGFNRGIYIYQLKDLTGKVIDSGKFQVER